MTSSNEMTKYHYSKLWFIVVTNWLNPAMISLKCPFEKATHLNPTHREIERDLGEQGNFAKLILFWSNSVCFQGYGYLYN